MIGQTGTAVDVEQVQVGMSVLALNLEDDTDADLPDVQGGVVVFIDAAADPDTGEVHRYFTTAKQWRREVRWAQLRGDQVRDVLPFDSAAVRRVVRAMARQVAEGKSFLSSDDLRFIEAMHALARTA